jgi:hypothetical protein
LAILGLAAVLLLAGPAGAQEARHGFRGGFYFGALYGSLSGPTFRYPGGGEQLSISQAKTVPNFVIGYDIGSGPLGAGLRMSYLTASFGGFVTPDMPGGVNLVGYADPKYTLIMGDIMLYWAPARSNLFSIYGFLGLGAGHRTYTVSGSVFPEWNGARSVTEFEYSYGLGLRVKPVRFVGLFGEFRLIPGDRTTEFKHFLYSDGVWDYYEYADSYTSHFTPYIAGGLSFHF